MRYDQYLTTPHWLNIKNEIYQMHRKCQICGATKNLDTHHITYQRIGHEKKSDLRLLCHDCHFLMHDLKRGIIYVSPADIVNLICRWLYYSYVY